MQLCSRSFHQKDIKQVQTSQGRPCFDKFSFVGFILLSQIIKRPLKQVEYGLDYYRRLDVVHVTKDNIKLINILLSAILFLPLPCIV